MSGTMRNSNSIGGPSQLDGNEKFLEKSEKISIGVDSGKKNSSGVFSPSGHETKLKPVMKNTDPGSLAPWVCVPGKKQRFAACRWSEVPAAAAAACLPRSSQERNTHSDFHR